jgi:hypothetical protein
MADRCNRLERYQAAVYLAQLMLENPESMDELQMEHARQDIDDELAAGRKNQREFPAALAAVAEKIGFPLFSVKVGGRHLRAVE